MNEPDEWSRPDPNPDHTGPAEGVKGSFFNLTAKERARDVLVNGATDRLHIETSPEKGRGIFASKEIKSGTAVFLACGDLRISHDETGECFWGNPMSIVVGNESDPKGACYEYIDGFTNNPLRYLNHSCEPNLGRSGPYMFVAMRDIAVGEELTADYSTLEANTVWHMNCRCGSPTCRGVIGGIQTLPRELVEKYRGYIPPFLLQIYEDSGGARVDDTRSKVRERAQLG
jgi:hypothetical protein